MVRLCLTDGRSVEGELFLCPDERLTDLLNDERAFLPLETGGGRSVAAIAKTAILSVESLATAPDERRDPYLVLGVERDASEGEIKKAWMTKLKATHPDRVIALGLDEQVVYAARRAASRVNAAYDEIRTLRKAAASVAA